MLYDTISQLKQIVSRRELFTLVSGVTAFHRIQASPGFEQAAEWCVKTLQQRGVQAKILHYPAVARGFAGGYRLFQQWNCREAWCRMTWPEQIDIADYSLEPISVIQKSTAADFRNDPVELVEMNLGSDEENYDGTLLTGKLLFVHQHINQFNWAIQKYGAAGIISDYLNETPEARCPEELLDTLNYTSYWWKHTADEKQAFGFVVTPRMSKQLHRACEKAEKAYQMKKSKTPYPQIKAFVDAELMDGESHVVEAVLPGESEESILMCAHLCHPCASANDNASGVSACIEALAAIQKGIQRGMLAPLKRTIRVILMPEFTGTYNYLTDGRDRKKYLAGINLDMVGAKQEGTTGPINITALPWAMPDCSGDLASLLLNAVGENVKTEEDQLLANVRTKVIPFGLGSDHFVLSDPAVGIPTVMMGQWPDKYYHTSSDTICRLDMNVLKFSTLVGAAFAYTLSNFTDQDAKLIWSHQRTRMLAEVERIQKQEILKLADTNIAERLSALMRFYKKCAESVNRYIEIDASKQVKWIESIIPETSEFKWTGKAWKRRLDTPVEMLEDLICDHKDKMQLLHCYEEKYREYADKEMAECLCGYYMDGCRSTDEIVYCVNAEIGKDNRELLEDYLQLLNQCELIY